MKIKQTMRHIIISAVLVFSAIVGAVALPSATVSAARCGGVKTSVIDCDATKKDNEELETSAVWDLLMMVINIMVVGVGVLALAGIVYGGVLYASAGGNPEQVKKAITIFTNVAIGVVAFAGMYTLLNFLIPGGVFN